MNWLRVALTSSVGKKFVMGITGLLLCGFLVAHLAGNVLLLVGAEEYNTYAHTLHKNPGLLMVAEVGLLLLFVTHIVLAFVTTRENRQARGPVGYARKESKIEERRLAAPLSPENWMFATGAVVLLFVLFHLYDFTFELRDPTYYTATVELHGETVPDAHTKALGLLRSGPTFVVYLVGCLFLGWHLGHGFSSAFQSLGINHPKYNRLIEIFGLIFAIGIAAGFAIFPCWAMFRSTAN